MNARPDPSGDRSDAEARTQKTADARSRSRWLLHLAALQLARPWAVLGLALLLTAASLALAMRLEIQPGFEALLPKSRPSVQELERVKSRTTGVSTVFVVLEGGDTPSLRKAADAIAVEAKKLGHPWVGSVESGPHDALAFLKPRAGLFAEASELQSLLDDWDEEVGRATGASLDEEEGDDETEAGSAKRRDALRAKFGAKSLKKRFGLEEDGRATMPDYPDGYYQSADGKVVVVTMRSAILGTDYAAGREALRRIRGAIDDAHLEALHRDIRYSMAGDLVTAISEYKAINEDLTEVGLAGTLMLIAVVFLYYLRLRMLLAMTLTIGIGVSLTFGVTQLLVGQLNMATGFLFTIVAGNGINSGIIYMARYLEERRKGTAYDEAIRVAHTDTWLATLTAAAAAGASYASLVATEFRGFRDFGIIGGIGMVLCWIATYAFLPPILIVAERAVGLSLERGGLFGLLPRQTSGGLEFGRPFAALVARAPRATTLLGVLIAVVGTVATARWVARDPMEYDLKNLRTDMNKRAAEVRAGELAVSVTRFVGTDGMAILADRLDQVAPLVTELERRRDAAPADAKPFKAVYTLQDLVAKDQEKKIPLLMELKDRLRRATRRGLITKDELAEIEPFLPPDGLRPYGLGDLPESAARAFTERDGTRGRVVYIEPISSDVVEDAHYLFRWSDAYRKVELPNGKGTILGSGRAVIYADIWSAVVADVPRLVALSLALTLVVVALSFRLGAATAIILASLLGGIAWMTGALALGDVKLNFLNFIALPLTFGIGVDYAVNIMQRYAKEGAGGMITAVRETGGAVVLCSATTMFGYLALVRSVNYAVRSMGVAAVLGEVACLVFAVLILPSALVWRDRLRSSRRDGATASVDHAA
ncbi:MAG: MMPL family transporter [Deltaproteobacteria bacterium]|nr:MMPL family transporter [Deltaproteobacteria bacterium]